MTDKPRIVSAHHSGPAGRNLTAMKEALELVLATFAECYGNATLLHLRMINVASVADSALRGAPPYDVGGVSGIGTAASAIEAGTAAAENTDAVHESAGPQDDAQSVSQ